MEQQAAASRAIEALHDWLCEQAWPLWRDYGVDRDAGGFHEALDATTLTCSVPFRRLRVLTRQIHVFSRAALHGLDGAASLVELGLDVLLGRAKQPDGAYAWRFALDGTVIDQRRDLYDHAFVLLALSSAAAIVPASRTRTEALAVVAWLDSNMRHDAGGYREALSPTGEPRRHNPHMHLLEATLAAWERFGDDPFLDRADELVALCLSRFFDRRAGALPEFFTETLSPLPLAGGNRVEPGHHSEWIWLLAWHRSCTRKAGRPVPEQSERAASALQVFSDRFGIHPVHGALIDAVTTDGRILSASARLWPQTERLKAAALRLAAGPERLAEALAAIAPYLDHPVKGLWHERRTAEGAFATAPVPASSLYHLTDAILFAHACVRASADGDAQPLHDARAVSSAQQSSCALSRNQKGRGHPRPLTSRLEGVQLRRSTSDQPAPTMQAASATLSASPSRKGCTP